MLGLAGAGVRHGYWHVAFFEARGGIVGELELWVAAHLIGSGGADILAVFLALAGVFLLSGGSLPAALRAGSTGLVSAVGTLRPPARPQPRPRPAPLAIVPPEPNERELVIRATHVEAPPIDITDFPDFGDPDVEHSPELEDVREPEPEPLVEEELAQQQLEVDPDLLTPQGRFRASVLEDPSFRWRLPPESHLTRSSAEHSRPDTAGQERIAAALVEALGHFGVQAKVIGTVAGPHITRYELRLAPGIKVGKVAQLKDDLAYALAATDVRILAPIPGKQAVGVEVPNAKRRIVRLGDVYQAPPSDWSPLTVWLGKDVAGRAIGADLAKMPLLLVAGTTGAGKSGAVNAMLSSILLRATPHEVRLVLVDPKQVELNHYESIPHLLTPVITNPRMAANALANLVREMEQRSGVMSLARTRSLRWSFNRARDARGEPPLPYILCVIDELADLMMVALADVEDSIIRLAQKARAVGIHLVLATQSPRVDVITGMIKANVPSRIAFAVSSQTDSRVILDQNGAESLLGAGDMLFAPDRHLLAAAHPGRLHRRGADRDVDGVLAPPGRAGVSRRAAGGGRVSRGRGGQRGGRIRSRRGSAAGGRDHSRCRIGHGVDLDAPAAPALLHARGSADRHARASRHHLGLRGFQASPGTRLRSRPAHGDRCARSTRAGPSRHTSASQPSKPPAGSGAG